MGRNFTTQGRTFPKLLKFLAKTKAATSEARGVKLQAKPKGSPHGRPAAKNGGPIGPGRRRPSPSW